MALRTIRKDDDGILRKISREVDVINEKILVLVKDMIETMYNAEGVGLAAPQVGILKRVIVIDVGDGPVVLINPKILQVSGEQVGIEGCLSSPGLIGEVSRPDRVVVEGVDIKGNKITVEGQALFARALCHEIDHLDGILFKDRAIRFLDEEELENYNRQKEV